VSLGNRPTAHRFTRPISGRMTESSADMNRTYSSFNPKGLRFLIVCTLFIVPAAPYSQETRPQHSVPLQGCRWPDLDTNFELVNGPGDLFTAAFVMRNISGSSCLLDRLAYGVNGSPTAPDRTGPNGKAFLVSPDSENRVWGTHPPFDVAPILAPGKVAYTMIQWKTKPRKDTDPCIQPEAINWPVKIVAPSLLGRLCSDISVTAFSLGEFHDPGKSKRESWRARDNEKLRLAAYGEGEAFFFRISLTDPHRAPRSPEHTFPGLYLRERSADGSTVFRAKLPTVEGHSPNVSSPVTVSPPPKQLDCNSGCDLSPECYETVGEHEFQVFQAVDVPEAGPIRFVHSNVLHIRWDASSVPQCRVIVTGSE